MIPKIIWQTYKDPFNDLPQYAKNAAQTWKDLNPEYKYIYMDDKEIESFIINEFDQEWLEIFNNYPLGVMRGDLFRYMITYIYGGVYADLDTICNVPISTWINTNTDMVICIDDDNINYAQLAFACTPKHPVLKTVLDLIKLESKQSSYSDLNFVHNTTGVYVWTKAVQLGFKNNNSIYCYNNEKSLLFHDGAITHLVGSNNWNTENYVQWQKEQIKYLKEKNA